MRWQGGNWHYFDPGLSRLYPSSSICHLLNRPEDGGALAKLPPSEWQDMCPVCARLLREAQTCADEARRKRERASRGAQLTLFGRQPANSRP
jgi:hypothetical protein